MEITQINTSIGDISVRVNRVDGSIPIIFLHGVYFDSSMWDYQVNRITDRTVCTIDMPFHGLSKNIINKNWTLDDCAFMLLEILDTLKFDKVIAVGHSWGSMTILRAANQCPGRFVALGLCNMPFKETTRKEARIITIQHFAMGFRKFYMKQAAMSLMGKDSIANNPALIGRVMDPMRKLSDREIKYIDKVVRIEAKDTTHLITNLMMPTFALVGKSDYVGIPPVKDTIVVKGGHVSPLEEPDEVFMFVHKIMEITAANP